MSATARIPARIRKFAKERGIIAAEFGRRMGFTPQWGAAIFRGETPLTMENLDRAADVLGVRPGDLVSHETLIEVSTGELKVIAWTRALPQHVRVHWLALVDHWLRREVSDRRRGAAKVYKGPERRHNGSSGH